MKVYMLYLKIPETEWSQEIRHLLPNPTAYNLIDDSYVGFYAWTDNEEMLANFLAIRDKKKYIVVPTKIKKSQYKNFRLEYKIYRIDYYSYRPDIEIKGHDDERHILSVFHENSGVMEDGDILFYDDMLTVNNYDYTFFKVKYQKCLDILGYTTLYDVLMCGLDDSLTKEETEEIESRGEFASYQQSYGLTVDGNEYLDISSNRFLLFLKNYQFAL